MALVNLTELKCSVQALSRVTDRDLRPEYPLVLAKPTPPQPPVGIERVSDQHVWPSQPGWDIGAERTSLQKPGISIPNCIPCRYDHRQCEVKQNWIWIVLD